MGLQIVCCIVLVFGIWSSKQSLAYDLLAREVYETKYSLEKRTGFRTFREMEYKAYRDYENGFPPGIYGSSIIPTAIWLHYWSAQKKEDMFPHSKSLFLAPIDWFEIISKCDEKILPRCSWKYFLALMQPTSYNEDLLSDIFNVKLDALNKDNKMVVPIVRGGCYPLRTVDQISLIYIYVICHFYKDFNESIPGLQVCPNPCRRNPCSSINHAVKGTCSMYGYHINDFQCECEQGFEWDNTTVSCAMLDLCKSICVEENTESCFLNRTSAIATCQCKSGYMNFDCSEELDMCIQGKLFKPGQLNVGPIVPSGYEACGTTLSSVNDCESKPKLQTFTCSCGRGYARDFTLPYDNCLNTIDSCDQRLCLHGQCTTSTDRTNSVCDCEEGFTGELCDEPVGAWSFWSSWSHCEPKCGPARHRKRMRVCLSHNESDCVGDIEQVRKCAEGISCLSDTSIEQETWLLFMNVTNNYMIYTLIYIAVIAAFITIFGLCRKYPKQKVPSPNTQSPTEDEN